MTRVLPTDGSNPRFETSVEGGGTLLGESVNLLATYWSEVRADGSPYGECPNSGVFMIQDGEVATFIASGAGGFDSPHLHANSVSPSVKSNDSLVD